MKILKLSVDKPKLTEKVLAFLGISKKFIRKGSISVEGKLRVGDLILLENGIKIIINSLNNQQNGRFKTLLPEQDLGSSKRCFVIIKNWPI